MRPVSVSGWQVEAGGGRQLLPAVMVPRLLLAALLAAALARPQEDCEIFGVCPEEPEECDEIFGCDSEEEAVPRGPKACFDEVNEIDDQENER